MTRYKQQVIKLDLLFLHSSKRMIEGSFFFISLPKNHLRAQVGRRIEGAECGDGDLQFFTNKRPVASDPGIQV